MRAAPARIRRRPPAGRAFDMLNDIQLAPARPLG
jgi:hypothetical protein